MVVPEGKLGEKKKAAPREGTVAEIVPSTSETARLAISLVVVAIYLGLLVTRNADWQNDEALFSSALKVCPRSAKVLLNGGILDRRLHHYAESIKKFELARVFLLVSNNTNPRKRSLKKQTHIQTNKTRKSSLPTARLTIKLGSHTPLQTPQRHSSTSGREWTANSQRQTLLSH